MKKIRLLGSWWFSSWGFTSCVFKGTATVTLHNDSAHNITTVNFVVISGGDTDNNSVSIRPKWTCSIVSSPVTYRIRYSG